VRPGDLDPLGEDPGRYAGRWDALTSCHCGRSGLPVRGVRVKCGVHTGVGTVGKPLSGQSLAAREKSVASPLQLRGLPRTGEGVTNAQKLRIAAGLLAEVRRDLDTRREGCSTCGVERYLNWLHHQWDETLKGGLRKLRRVADEMDRREVSGPETIS